MPPGRALDAGCGEGSDAVRLAQLGWTVTAVDLSAVAIERNRTMPLPPDVAARITWLAADLTRWTPPAGAFDLVASMFVHLDAEHREPVFRKLAAAVAPGGMLLVVAHHPNDRERVRRFGGADRYYGPEPVLAALGDAFTNVRVEARPRPLVRGDGTTIEVEDLIVSALRPRSA